MDSESDLALAAWLRASGIVSNSLRIIVEIMERPGGAWTPKIYCAPYQQYISQRDKANGVYQKQSYQPKKGLFEHSLDSFVEPMGAFIMDEF